MMISDIKNRAQLLKIKCDKLIQLVPFENNQAVVPEQEVRNEKISSLYDEYYRNEVNDNAKNYYLQMKTFFEYEMEIDRLKRNIEVRDCRIEELIRSIFEWYESDIVSECNKLLDEINNCIYEILSFNSPNLELLNDMLDVDYKDYADVFRNLGTRYKEDAARILGKLYGESSDINELKNLIVDITLLKYKSLLFRNSCVIEKNILKKNNKEDRTNSKCCSNIAGSIFSGIRKGLSHNFSDDVVTDIFKSLVEAGEIKSVSEVPTIGEVRYKLVNYVNSLRG